MPGSIVIPLLRSNPMKLTVPPGGFAGFAQQTAATQELFRRAGRLGGQRTQRKRRKSAKKKAVRASGRKRRSGGKKARLVKGSAAAKRYMASIRRKRKR
jgi:hypothetical protein